MVFRVLTRRVRPAAAAARSRPEELLLRQRCALSRRAFYDMITALIPFDYPVCCDCAHLYHCYRCTSCLTSTFSPCEDVSLALPHEQDSVGHR